MAPDMAYGATSGHQSDTIRRPTAAADLQKMALPPLRPHQCAGAAGVQTVVHASAHPGSNTGHRQHAGRNPVAGYENIHPGTNGGTHQNFRTMKRRRRFYYEIHLSEKYMVAGSELFSGMLEADREVERKAAEIAERINRPLRGCIIMEQRLRKRS